MSVKHTPGPWEIDELGSSLVTYVGIPVAKAMDNCDTREETLANAALIAAAPDLLEALQTAADLIVDMWYSAKGNAVTGSDVEAVRQRIALTLAKAKGGAA